MLNYLLDLFKHKLVKWFYIDT